MVEDGEQGKIEPWKRDKFLGYTVPVSQIISFACCSVVGLMSIKRVQLRGSKDVESGLGLWIWNVDWE